MLRTAKVRPVDSTMTIVALAGLAVVVATEELVATGAAVEADLVVLSAAVPWPRTANTFMSPNMDACISTQHTISN